MKKNVMQVFWIVAVLSVLGALVWYIMPTTLTNLLPADVEEISIFYAGNTVYITEEEEIYQYISNWNEIYLKKEKSAEGYSGFTFIVYILLRDGTTTRFVVNGENVAVMDGYFYTTTDKTIEFDQMLGLFDRFY